MILLELWSHLKLRDEIKYLYDKTDFDIEMHTHNDFGMATANAIAGIMVEQLMLE